MNCLVDRKTQNRQQNGNNGTDRFSAGFWISPINNTAPEEMCCTANTNGCFAKKATFKVLGSLHRSLTRCFGAGAASDPFSSIPVTKWLITVSPKRKEPNRVKQNNSTYFVSVLWIVYSDKRYRRNAPNAYVRVIPNKRYIWRRFSEN